MPLIDADHVTIYYVQNKPLQALHTSIRKLVNSVTPVLFLKTLQVRIHVHCTYAFRKKPDPVFIEHHVNILEKNFSSLKQINSK